MDLIKIEILAESLSGFADLAAKGREGVILHLVDVGVGAPARGVDVAPLGAHDRGARRKIAQAKPDTEEVLREAVGASYVEVADAARPRHARHRA